MGDYFDGNLLAAFYTSLILIFFMGVIVGLTVACLRGHLKKSKAACRAE